uniref:Flightin n=1 Tax=Clastoptera arizonana TaxID=38151 RepID=A0A1B6D8T3_9HEMI
MADPEDDWLNETFEETPEEEEKAEEAPAEEAAPEEALPVEEVPEEPLEPPPPPKEPITVFRHWERPVFLNYKYIMRYYHNYYDDVIDYLDRKLAGLSRDTPHAQTWAERMLRLYTWKPYPSTYYYIPPKCTYKGTLKVAHTWRSQHSTQFFIRKYVKLTSPIC